MATPGSNVISVPKPKAGTFRPHRPLERNLLVKAMVQHFKEADQNLPPELKSGVDADAIRTEGEAAGYIRKVTEAIHRGGGRARKVRRAG